MPFSRRTQMGGPEQPQPRPTVSADSLPSLPRGQEAADVIRISIRARHHPYHKIYPRPAGGSMVTQISSLPRQTSEDNPWPEDFAAVQAILKTFGDASRLRTNMAKSVAYPNSCGSKSQATAGCA
ncbi:uncharacterized protein [Aegilops tauschii subsp. strangulata]|uniref:uncharacterized protein isoform X2 n=1 Tax=Aegilops tauschii subsp. strangulata TaxID=200361 RepID=UPI00098ABFF5|nr:uncharacterized protein LOC109778876 isoform X2 [Aegilops tauschii subsp. strangulata]